MGPFYGWGSTASRLEPLGGSSLLFTTNTLKMFLFAGFAKLQLFFTPNILKFDTSRPINNQLSINFEIQKQSPRCVP